MATKGKAIEWSDKDLDSLSSITPESISKAQAWATPELQNLLTATPDDELNANPKG